ncbi:tellurium resistance protein [Streptomyces abyssomicinicus]|uniref:tellurium resistance protein n=1 Tax=Streptomyces abyssomicinicus TaxID=574929 RepID=UPI001FE740A1|nr:tellurium resistance protein [Streptomyces abyssomicinicus]
MSGDGRRRGVIQLKPTGDRPRGVVPPAEPERAPERSGRAPELSGRAPAGPGRTVELTSRSPHARIAGRGRLQVNLNWSASASADLDLGCLVRTRDGQGEAVQPLGANFGSYQRRPYVELDQDDRTGGESDGETLRVNLEHWREFEQLVVYVYVYEGAVDFRTLGGVVTVTAPSGTWRIHLDDSPAGATACAIARLVPGTDGLDLTREVRWFSPLSGASNQQQIDRAYGFGLEWVWATK